MKIFLINSLLRKWLVCSGRSFASTGINRLKKTSKRGMMFWLLLFRMKKPCLIIWSRLWRSPMRSFRKWSKLRIKRASRTAKRIRSSIFKLFSISHLLEKFTIGQTALISPMFAAIVQQKKEPLLGLFKDSIISWEAWKIALKF